MSHVSHINYLVTSGNRGLYPAGQSIYANVPGGGLLVSAGEPVLYNAQTYVAIAPGDIPTTPFVVFAVGVGKIGGRATALRHLGGERFNLCEDKIKATATSPRCAEPQIVDTFFDCIDGSETHTLEVHLDDSWIRSTSGYNGVGKYSFSSQPGCPDCDACNATGTCGEVACQLVDVINGRVQEDPTKISRFVNWSKDYDYQPFRAALLWNLPTSIKRWCLTPTDDGCENCVNFPAISGVTIDNVSTVFVGTNDGTNTTVEHFPTLLTQLNAVLEASHARAHMSTPIGKCCGSCLEISTCAVNITFDLVGGGSLAPTEAYNPFQTFNLPTACRGCGTQTPVASPTCGIRIYTDPVSVECLCDFPPADNPPNYYGRTVTVHAVGDNWAGCNNFFTAEVQAQVLPEGFGYFYKHKERYQSKGGSGKDFSYGNYTKGSLIPLPQEGSRDLSTTAVCDQTYCVYNVLSLKGANGFHNNQTRFYNNNQDQVLVPSADAVTRGVIESVLVALQAAGTCVGGNVICQP